MSFNTTLGYTTVNNEWEVLSDKELAKHDLLLQLYTRKGECDWDPSFGTSILDKIFRPKTEELKLDIINEINEVFDSEPRLDLLNIETESIEKGWKFICQISYLNGTPDYWELNVSEDFVRNNSNGYYDL